MLSDTTQASFLDDINELISQCLKIVQYAAASVIFDAENRSYPLVSIDIRFVMRHHHPSCNPMSMNATSEFSVKYRSIKSLINVLYSVNKVLLKRVLIKPLVSNVDNGHPLHEDSQ